MHKDSKLTINDIKIGEIYHFKDMDDDFAFEGIIRVDSTPDESGIVYFKCTILMSVDGSLLGNNIYLWDHSDLIINNI